MSHDERRQHPRIQAKHKVVIELDDIFASSSSYSQDISVGGIFVVTDIPIPIGTHINLEIVVDADQTIAAEAKVVHLRDSMQANKVGLGLQFVRMTKSNQRMLEQLLLRFRNEETPTPAFSESAQATPNASTNSKKSEGNNVPLSNKVLVIEDDTEVFELINKILSNIDLDVEHAANGVQGLEMALANEYSLLIVDGLLPQLDGLKIIKAVRESGSQVPILVMSAVFRTEQVIKNFNEAGADRFLTKPFKLTEFKQTVMELRKGARNNEA